MNKELYAQLQHVIHALAADLYHPLGNIPLSGFKADRDYSLSEAVSKARFPFIEDTAWGVPGEYAWMFGEICVPSCASGERIVMDLNPGGEATLFVDGQEFGTRRADHLRHPHHYIVDQTIVINAKGNEKISLAMEVYAGTPLPADPGQPVFPEEGVRFEHNDPAVIGHSTFGFWNEEAYQLWLDLDMLREIYDFLDDNDCFREKITLYIGQMMDQLDMEKPLAERRKAYSKAREIIAPLMQAHNGSFAPSMAVVGNSHLDFAWLWTTDETRRKTARTFAAQLRLLEEYPEAVFLQSQCAEYELCRQYYPDLFEKVRKAITDGRWIADGGMWVEPDTNMTGGESLVRQFLYGKKYFREQLGVESRVAWLPDTFGYSAALPQIIRKFNMEGLTTQKIYWSYNDSEVFPHHAFMWKGMDGSEISCYLHMFYETPVNAATLHTRWNSRVERDGSGDFFLPFGYGDGGGGPTRDDMEQIRRQNDLQGCPRLYYTTPYEYLIKRKAQKLPVYRGELYFPCHRGTYTTQSAVKKLNRKAENAMRTWEMLAAYAAFAGKTDYPKDDIESTWKVLLINQFHDILPGSAIGPVYTTARKQLKDVIAFAEKGAAIALSAFRTSEQGETVFNPSTHCTNRLADNEPIRIEPFGTALIETDTERSVFSKAFAKEIPGGYVMENDVISVTLNMQGEVIRAVTKKDQKDRVRSISNRFHLYRDLPRIFDAWDIDSQTEQREIEIHPVCRAEILCSGENTASIRFINSFFGSVITQTVILNAFSARLDFDTEVDWHEQHRLLKVSFDTGIDADEAAHQIQFGFINRPAHRSRRYDMDRFEVCNHAYTALFDSSHGAAVLNDCKYGVGTNDGVISLSLLRAPTYPDENADQGKHSFRYSYYVWDGAFSSSDILRETEDINIPLLRVSGHCMLEPLVKISSPTVTVESVKLAEDGSGDMILRMYESMKGTTTAEAAFPFTVADVWECDLEENRTQIIKHDDHNVYLQFDPFEIKTIRIKNNKP